MVTPPKVLDAMRSLEPDALAMDVLRTALSLVGGALRHRPEGGDASDATWALAGAAAARGRPRAPAAGRGAGAPPDPSPGFVENYLHKLSGTRPEPTQARALDAYFTLAADHGMNASTFTARVIASTLSDIGSAWSAASVH